MLLLPFEKIVYKTLLKSDEIVLRLSGIVGPKRLFEINSDKPYTGRFGDRMFEIERAIGHRNSYNPKIFGVIDSTPEGTTIHVTMRLSRPILIFTCLWLLTIGALSVASATDHLFSRASSNGETILFIGMFVFGYGITMAGFKTESIKSRKYLLQLLQGEIVNHS
jgi:hypothetical protein